LQTVELTAVSVARKGTLIPRRFWGDPKALCEAVELETSQPGAGRRKKPNFLRKLAR
jgi:hypothetical protein